MKRRLLSLLLVMAMLLSMVPFQAFAEEAEEAPVLLEETEEIVSEPTEEIIPETTEETVPETTQETVPELIEETVPAITEETTPEVSEEAPLLLEETVEAEGIVAEGATSDLIQIKIPSSARVIEEEDGEKYVIMTAGQKLSLSTVISKDIKDKAVTWEIVGPSGIEPSSLAGSPAPEGATASGAYWDAIASIDSKGVLRTNAGVTPDNCVIRVRATLTSSLEEGQDPVFDVLPVLVQSPVESFWVNVRYPQGTASAPENVSPEGGVNRKDNWPWGLDINAGSFEIYAYGFQPQWPADGVKWSVKVSSKVAEWYETKENTIIVTPKAPGKLTFTATAKDGSGAKYSGIVEIYGNVDHVSISTPENFDKNEPLHPGETLKLSATAYYDEDEQCPISGGKYRWSVYDRLGNGHDFATIDKNGKLTITNKVNRPAELNVEVYYETKIDGYFYGDYASVPIQVEPSNERTLALAAKYGEPDNPQYTIVPTADAWPGEPGLWTTVAPVWLDTRGEVIEEVSMEDVTYKVSGSACSFDTDTGELVFEKIGTTKITATVTLGGKDYSVTCSFRGMLFTDSIQIQNKPGADGCITVLAGKTLSLKAINYCGTKKATSQDVCWKMNREDYNYAWIDPNTGKLYTDYNSVDHYVTVTAEPNGHYTGEPSATIQVHIIPEKTQYRSYAYIANDNVKNGYLHLTDAEQTLKLNSDLWYRVESYGRDTESHVTDIISSNPKIATVVKDDSGNVTKITIPADAKTGKVTFTIKGQVLAGATWVDGYYDGESGQYVEGYWEGGEWVNAPSAKLTITTVKPVTSIVLSRPTNKDGSVVPAYVGKSLKLTATVNPDATNKKLYWDVRYYNGDPEGEFDWEEDKDKLKYLDGNDNTTVQNGVLKIDKSWYTHGRCYAVFAISEDINTVSDPIFIQAYGMTGSIEIWSAGEFDPETHGYECLDKVNNHTITIMPGEEVEFAARVYDVAGNITDCYQEDIYDEVTGELIDTVLVYNHGANPDVKWTISGNKGYVDFEDTFDGGLDTLKVTGKNHGTVTVKVSANDGSKKTATFKIEVGIPPVTEAPGPQ